MAFLVPCVEEALRIEYRMPIFLCGYFPISQISFVILLQLEKDVNGRKETHILRDEPRAERRSGRTKRRPPLQNCARALIVIQPNIFYSGGNIETLLGQKVNSKIVHTSNL